MRISVDIDFTVPADVSEMEFEEWFKYSVLGWGSCSNENPLIDQEAGDLVSNYYIQCWG